MPPVIKRQANFSQVREAETVNYSYIRAFFGLPQVASKSNKRRESPIGRCAARQRTISHQAAPKRTVETAPIGFTRQPVASNAQTQRATLAAKRAANFGKRQTAR